MPPVWNLGIPGYSFMQTDKSLLEHKLLGGRE
jgi:hypothetical protein